jgi:hypothetical protein
MDRKGCISAVKTKIPQLFTKSISWTDQVRDGIRVHFSKSTYFQLNRRLEHEVFCCNEIARGEEEMKARRSLLINSPYDTATEILKLVREELNRRGHDHALLHKEMKICNHHPTGSPPSLFSFVFWYDIVVCLMRAPDEVVRGVVDGIGVVSL